MRGTQMFKKKIIAMLLIFISTLSISCYAATPGDSVGGGTVICVFKPDTDTKNLDNCVTDKDASGNKGLIVANEDQVNYDSNPWHGVAWSSETKKSVGAYSKDDGQKNTAAIINALPNDNSTNNAAWLCGQYNGGGYKDWFLPSLYQLKKMYTYAKENYLIGKDCSGSKSGGIQCFRGGSDNHKAYWSSTESLSLYAWACKFGKNYNQFKYSKDCPNLLAVRAVRAFSEKDTTNYDIKNFKVDKKNTNEYKLLYDCLVNNFSKLSPDEQNQIKQWVMNNMKNLVHNYK